MSQSLVGCGKHPSGWRTIKRLCVYVSVYYAASRNAGDDVEEDRPSSAADIETVPDEADFLLAMATVTGYVSYRSRSLGSWYITTLVEILKKYAKR